MPMLQLSRNLEIHYEEIGTGQPLLFIHGVWCSGRYFRNSPLAVDADLNLKTIQRLEKLLRHARPTP